MEYKNYNNLWKTEFDNIVSPKNKMQDIYLKQLKIEVYDTYKKMRK